MATETWSGYPPEVNSGRWEAGTGPETWMAASAVWTDFAGIVLTATGALMGEIAMMTGSTLTGTTSVAMLASSVPFIGWLASMEALALAQAMACATVSGAWSTATAGIIPLPVVTQNRITEANLQATNFFGVNSAAIAEMNREYGQFWTQDGSSMMNYDQAVVLATTPKMAPPPPPLSNMGSASQLAPQAAQTAANAAQNASKMSDVGSEMQNLADSGAQSGDPMSMMSSMMSPMQSVMSSAQGALNPQSLMQPAQSLMQPLQSMLGQFMTGPQMGGGLNGNFGSGLNLSNTGGVPLGGSTMGGGMGGGGMGGSMGGGAPLGTLNSSSSTVKPISNLSGVPAPTMGSGNQAQNGGMRGGGGAGPMGGMGGGNQQGSSRKSEVITAAHVDNNIYNQVDPAREKAMFR